MSRRVPLLVAPVSTVTSGVRRTVVRPAALPAWDAVEQRRLARRARRHRHRCRDCRRRITDPVSLRFMLGSGCRRKRGITGRRLQVSRTIRVRDPGHVTGQLALPLGPMGIIR